VRVLVPFLITLILLFLFGVFTFHIKFSLTKNDDFSHLNPLVLFITPFLLWYLILTSGSCALVWQVLYHFSHISIPFCFCYFSVRVFCFKQEPYPIFLPHHPIYTYHIAGLTGMHHHPHFFIG
jgi:hypothetical protein